MRRLVGALLVLVSAAVARADDTGTRVFTVEFGGRDEALREDCTRRLSAWWDEIVSPDRTPAGWDEKKLGPWAFVTRTSGGGFVEEKPGLLHVMVQVVSDALPSRKETADAFAAAALAGLRERVMARASPLLAEAEVTLQDALTGSRLRTEPLEAERSRLELTHGGAPDDRAGQLTARRADVDRDVADTRIQLAVAAKKLETARAAAERAVSLERLRHDADEISRRVRDAGTVAEQATAREALTEVQRKIDDLSKSTPSLDTARETAFRIEVDRVGLEARATVLAEERATLDDSLRQVRRDAVRWLELQRALDVESARRAEAQSRFDEARRAAAERGQVFEVIRAPGPPSKDEKFFQIIPALGPSKEEKKR